MSDSRLVAFANPLVLQSQALEDLQNKILNGSTVNDPNNVFSFLLEMTSSNTAGAVQEMIQTFPSLYRARAQTSQDLYKHMSDFDYVNLFSTPADFTLSLVFDRNFLIDNAVAYNTNYKKIIIPAYSTFLVGKYTFGIHYPIEIRIREVYDPITGLVDYDKCVFSIAYDISNPNPLHIISNNVLDYITYKTNNIDALIIKIPAKQFIETTYTLDVVSSVGFYKKYAYNDKFYAARIFHYKDNVWSELGQTLSDDIYDPSSPTVKVTVFQDTSEVAFSIPQVYFTKNLIGTRVMIKMYTTMGELDVDISALDVSEYSASFLVDDEIQDDTYSSMLKRLATLQVLPVSSKILGGSNGLTFEQIKSRVVSETFGDKPLITNDDIHAHFENNGFIFNKYQDGITNRIFLAQKILTDNAGVIISSGDFKTKFTESTLETEIVNGKYEVINHSTIKTNGSSVYTILPSTIYKYDTSINACVPLTNDETSAISKLTLKEKSAFFNKGSYTFSPFHIRLETDNDDPIACSYNLLSPSVSDIRFEWENTNIVTQVSMYTGSLVHDNYGTGGYKFYVKLYKTSDISTLYPIDPTTLAENIKVVLQTTSSSGKTIYQEATYVGESTDDKAMSTMMFKIDTDYNISSNDTLDTTSFNESGLQKNTFDLPFVGNYKLIFFVNKNVNTSGDALNGVDLNSLPSGYSDYIPVCKQTLVLTLGKAVDEVFNNVSSTVTGQSYLTYPTTKFATYAANVYRRGTNGNVIYPLEILHKQGDLILTSPSGDEIPPSCFIKVNNIPNELRLEQPYTVFSDYHNVWKSRDIYTEKYKIEVVDLLKHALAKATTVNSITDLYVSYTTGNRVDPKSTAMFAWVNTVDNTENSTPENTLGIDGTGALYRRDYDLTAFDLETITSKNNIKLIYQDVDNALTINVIATKYNLSISDVSKIIKCRFPWIKVVTAATKAAITTYMNAQTAMTGVSLELMEELKEAARSSTTTSYASNAAMQSASLADTVVYVTNDTSEGSSVITDLVVPEGENKIAYWIYSSSTWTKLISGPSIDAINTELKQYTTYFGMIYLVSKLNTTTGLYDIKYSRILSYNSSGICKIDRTVSWSTIDQWVWELSKWVDCTSATYVSDMTIELNLNSNARIDYIKGAYIIDPLTSKPILDVENGRKYVYHINMLHLDYKLTLSQNTEHKQYRAKIVELLNSYFVFISETRNKLYESTKLYFSPIRTIGSVDFKSINGTIVNMPLDVGLKLRLYVQQYVNDNTSVQSIIKKNVFKIIDSSLSSGTISCVNIAEQIVSSMSDNIQFVDVLGINGITDLQTLIVLDTQCNPHLKQLLVVRDDGTLGIDRDLTLEFAVI